MMKGPNLETLQQGRQLQQQYDEVWIEARVSFEAYKTKQSTALKMDIKEAAPPIISTAREIHE